MVFEALHVLKTTLVDSTVSPGHLGGVRALAIVAVVHMLNQAPWQL
jgi:hypothetical protein